jgi:hypothetical protein
VQLIRAQTLAGSGTGSSATTGAGTFSGASTSKSQPSFKQVRTVPILLRFSTMKGAPQLGLGSGLGLLGVVKSKSGYR